MVPEGGIDMSAWLEKGEDVYEITGPVTTIGRDDTNDVTFPIDLVSRVHAILYEKDGSYFIRDLGSLNGTSVNGEKIAADMALRNGDVVTVGFQLTFRMGDAPPGGRQREKRPEEAYQRRTQAFPGAEPPKT